MLRVMAKKPNGGEEDGVAVVTMVGVPVVLGGGVVGATEGVGGRATDGTTEDDELIDGRMEVDDELDGIALDDAVTGDAE